MKIDPATIDGYTSGSTTLTERPPRPAAEVAGRLQQRVGQPLEPRVHRQDHVRQPQVRQRDDDRDDAVAGPVEAERLEQPGDHAGVRLRPSPARRRPSPGSDAHSGVMTSATSSPRRPRLGHLGHEERHRHGEHAQITVTAAAMPTVRNVAPM